MKKKRVGTLLLAAAITAGMLGGCGNGGNGGNESDAGGRPGIPSQEVRLMTAAAEQEKYWS